MRVIVRFIHPLQARSALAATRLCLMALLAGFAVPKASAATYYWDNNGSTAGFGTAGGTWAAPTTGNVSQGWSTNSGGTMVPGSVTTTSADGVNFGTATLALGSGTVTISGSVTNNTITFATNSPITLSGGTLVLAGASATLNGSAPNAIINSAILLLNDATINAPDVNTGTSAAVPLTLGGAISGAADVIFNGVQANNAYGTIILNAASDYQGSTLVTTVSSTGGANNTEIFLKLGTANALPVTTVLTMDGQTGTGSGRFTVLNLNGLDQTLAGLTNVTRTLRDQRIINNNATTSTLTISNSADWTFSGRVGVAGTAAANGDNLALTKSGSGVLNLTGNNAYTGNTTVNGGTLKLLLAKMSTNSTVSVAAGAVLQLDFAGTNVVAGFVTNGVALPSGVYSAANAAPFLAGTGSLEVAGAGPVVPSPTLLTNSFSLGTLNLSWPAGQNWRLEQQTNALSKGLSTNWVDITPGSASSTNIAVDNTKPTTFYRLAYP